MKYKDLVLEARKKTLKLTLEQQREILKIYEDTIRGLAEVAEKSGEKSLNKRWVTDYMKQVKAARDSLHRQLNEGIRKSIEQAGKNAVGPDLELFKMAQRKAGIDLGNHFTEMFSQVPHNVLGWILKGDLYRDGKGLSERIWNYTNDFEKDIDYILKRGIAEKKSAVELAKDLETFVKPESRRPWDWGNVYPKLRTKQVDYNAQRLARTSITHAHRESQYESAKRNPFVDAIHWELSGEHYARQVARWGEDECDVYASQNWYGLGVGNFPVDEVPISHPQCLCVTYPVISKSFDQIADELKAWVQGENPELDEFFETLGRARPEGAKDDIIKLAKEYKDRLNQHPREIKIEMDDIYKEYYRANLNRQHIYAAEAYQGTSYRTINNFLRGKYEYLDEEHTRVINDLKECITKVELKEDVIVVRGTTTSWLKGITWDELEAGDVLTEDAFMSTSLSNRIAESFAERKRDRAIIAELKANKGTKALFVDTAVNDAWESELLFKPGARVIVEEKWVDSDGIKRLKGMVVSE